jgi:hypothetical protein
MQYSAATKTTTTFLNGITMTPKGPDATAQNNGDAWNDFFIGQSPTSADYRLQGYIGEILIYNSVLSTVDRKKVESYLSLKYGLGIAITRVYTFPTSITFTSLQTSASSTTLSFSPADGFDSASVIIYYHATNSSTSPTQCGTGTINSSGSATITCTLPENQVVYIYAKVTSPTTGVESPLICSALSGTVTVLPSAVLSLDADTYTSGTILYDTSGNGYNANFSSPAPTYSKVNGIAMFTFTSSEDALVGNISDSIFKSAHSISCWFRRTSISNWAGLFSNNVNPVHSCSNLTFSAGTNSMGFEAVSAAGGTIAQVDLGTDYLNTWVYATVTLSGATIGSSVKTYVYKNGSLLTVGTGTLTWNLLSSTSYFIGKLLTGPHQFIGDIAVVQIYNRVLSASEISQNYNNLKTRFGF